MLTRFRLKGFKYSFVLIITFLHQGYSVDYFVAPAGKDSNSGSIQAPFATMRKAILVMKPGDVCYLRAGRYHEGIILENIHGLPESPLVFSAYKKEKVTVDGSEVINTKWSKEEGNIYKARIEKDIWQLFVGNKSMISARWPNTSWEEGAMFKQAASWAHQNEGSEYGLMINDLAYHDLASEEKDFTGAIAILNIGSWATYTSPVTLHKKGSDRFEYNANVEKRLENPTFWNSYLKQGWYFLEASLACLDTAGEWYYNKDTRVLYFWPEENLDPNELEIKGKTITYSPHFIQSSHIQFKNIDFFGVTFNIEDSEHILIENCRLKYPSYSKRMLGSLEGPDVTRISNQDGESSNNIIRNCEFTLSDGTGIQIEGKNNRIENCYFHHLDYSGVSSLGSAINGTNGIGTVIRRNTVHTNGGAQGILGGKNNLIELNHIYDIGRLQSDGAQIHISPTQQPGTIVRYNWVHDAAQSSPYSKPKHGIRFDGSFIGYKMGKRDHPHQGTAHHNVVWNTNDFYIKGDEHQVYNNLSFDNINNDLGIRSRVGQPTPKGFLDGYDYNTGWTPGADHPEENDLTITRNNLAGQISSSKVKNTIGLPGRHSNNIEDDVRNQLRDPDNLDFRPRKEAMVVDAGYYVEGVNENYAGETPDIGAYEYGDTIYWIPGQKREKASVSIPPNQAMQVKSDADLMFLEAYQVQLHEIYLGTDKSLVEKAGKVSAEYRQTISNNIYKPGLLEPGKTYYWRVDAVLGKQVVKGDVWSFTVEKK